MKRLKSLALLLMVSAFTFAFNGCTEKEETSTSSTDTTIYGTVFDKATGEPVRAATVSFVMAHASGIAYGSKTIASTVTGMDGAFELVFGKVESDITYLRQMIVVTCSGYKDNAFNVTVTPGEGNKYKMDFVIEK